MFFYIFSPAASLWHLTFLNSRSDLSNGWEAWPWRRSIPHPTHVMCIQLLFKWRSDDKLSNCHRVSTITSEEWKRKSKWTQMSHSEAISSILYSTYLLDCQSICVAACCILILCHISHHIILSPFHRLEREIWKRPCQSISKWLHFPDSAHLNAVGDYQSEKWWFAIARIADHSVRSHHHC